MRADDLPPVVDAAIEQVLIPARQVRRWRQQQRLLHSARQQASQLLRKAGRQAEQIQRQAELVGYESGIVLAVGHLLDYVQHSSTRLEETCQQIAGETGQLLSKILLSDKAFIAAVAHWSQPFSATEATQGGDAEQVCLLLPACCRHLMPQMRRIIRQSWGGRVVVEYHAEMRLVMRYRQHIAEFDPALLIEELHQSVLQKLPDFSTEDLTRETREKLRALFLPDTFRGNHENDNPQSGSDADYAAEYTDWSLP